MQRQLFKLLRYGLMLLALGLLAMLLARIDAAELLALLVGLSPAWLALCLLLVLLNFLCATRRFQCLAAPDLAFARVFEIMLASYLLNFAAMVQGLGLGAKIGLMKARRVPVSRSVAGIAVEMLLDLVFCSLVAVLLFAVARGAGFSGGERFLALLLFPAVALLLFALRGVILRWPFAREVRDEFVAILQSGRGGWVVACTMGIWLCAGLGFWCLLAAAGFGTEASAFQAVAANCLGFLTSLVSMIPGGLGVRELTWAWFVHGEALTLALAGLLALSYRLLTILLVLALLGWISWRGEGEAGNVGN